MGNVVEVCQEETEWYMGGQGKMDESCLAV